MDWRIAMVWREERLTFLEQLCLRSFLAAGHAVDLYSYRPVAGVPDGVTCRDAAEVLPEAELQPGTDDRFKYRLLATSEAVIWADPDVLCLRRLAPVEGYLFGWEDARHVSGGVLALPRDSAALARIGERLADGTSAWGSRLLTEALRETGEIARALPPVAFHAFGFAERGKLLARDLDHAGTITGSALALHLYAPRLCRFLARTDSGLPDPESLLGKLLVTHGIDPAGAPLEGAPAPDRDHPVARRYRAAAAGRPEASVPPPPVRPLDRVVAVATVRNEGPFLLDWMAYHLGLGVTHFLIYCHASDDATRALLDALAERGLVTRVDVPPSAGRKPGRWVHADAKGQPALQAADAVVFLDADEYINIHAGEGRLSDLFRAAGDPDLISMTRRLFGTSGVTAYADRPVAEQFTRAERRLSPGDTASSPFRTLFRRDAPFQSFGGHRPRHGTGPMPRWTNGSGRQMPDRYLDGGWRSDGESAGYDLVTLNRYATRSCESFLVGQDGLPGPDEIATWETWNRNDESDRSILPRLELARPARAHFAADPVISALHDRAVAWHCARIDALCAAPRPGALFAALAADPLAASVAPTDLPPATPVPGAAREVFPLRRHPPATGTAARAQFEGLMSRMHKQQVTLTPLDAPPPSRRVVIVTSMKNEGAFILEWIAYHLSIGVTHFLVYTNDCDDPTDAILDRLEVLGHVTRRDNPFNREAGQKPQRGALNDAIGQPAVQGADWVGVIDVDEFVNIHAGDGTFAALLRAAHDPNVISMTWRFFGNRGVHAFEDRWQTEQFTACAPLYIPKPRLGWGFKSFFRPDAPFGKIGVHRPLDLDTDRAKEVRWVNGAGRVMPERMLERNEWFSRKDTIGYDLVTLNHYVLRSAESFLVKRQRGRINHVDQDQGVGYWCRRNYATETDLSIQAHLPRAKATLARLLADEALFRLHGEAVAWHRDRIAALLAEDDYRALYEAITDPGLPDAIWRDRVAEDDETRLAAAE